MSNGEILFVERIADVDGNVGQVKIRGNRIECSEIEALLTSVEGVKAIKVIPDKAHNNLVAFVVLQHDDSTQNADKISSQFLKEQCLNLLHFSAIPREFIIIESFPLTANDKIDFDRLYEMLEAHLNSKRTFGSGIQFVFKLHNI